jgi:hypothetical protein
MWLKEQEAAGIDTVTEAVTRPRPVHVEELRHPAEGPNEESTP